MAWVRIDDLYSDHYKTKAVGPLGSALQVAALCHCNRYGTNGFVSYFVAKTLIDLDGIAFIDQTTAPHEERISGYRATWTVIVEALVDAGMWETVEGGWQIHDYDEYQHTSEDRARHREQNAARQRALRERRKTPPDDDGNALRMRDNHVTSRVNNDDVVVVSPPPDPDPDPDPVPAPEPEPARARALSAPVPLHTPARTETRERARARWLDERFAEFCATYPGDKRFGDDLRAIWPDHCRDPASFAAIMAGLAAWSACGRWQDQAGRFAANPLEFLGKRLYRKDAPPAAAPSLRPDALGEAHAAREILRQRQNGVAALTGEPIDASFTVAAKRGGGYG